MVEVLHLLAALGRDLRRRVHFAQAAQRCAHQVDRVTRADSLGQHVLDAHGFQHGAHRATGDDAGTFGRRLHEHARRAVAGLDRVPQGAVVQVDVDEALAGVLHRLLDGHRHFARLAITEADLAVAITHHRQCGEGELATALDGLADAVDRDQLLDHAVVGFLAVAITIAAPRSTLFFCHFEYSVVEDICGVAAYGCELPRMSREAGNPYFAPDAARVGRLARRGDGAPRPQARPLRA